MAVPGRKPKPTHLKILDGDRPCRINKNEPKPRPVKPRCPAYLSKAAKREFRKILKAAPWITEADAVPVALLAQALTDWRKAHERKEIDGVVTETKYHGWKKHPAIAVMKSREDLITKLLSELGLTPSSRSRITIPKDDDPGDLGDLIR